MVKKYFCIALILLANHAVNGRTDTSQNVLFNQIYSAAEKEYGIHQELINGMLFENNNLEAVGHPYFFLDAYSNQGSVIYRGKHYSNLDLRYDIYDQQLLLIYDFGNILLKAYLQNEFISEFNIENKQFINEAFGDNVNNKFYQVIGRKYPVKILYYWEKGLSNLYINNSDIKKFSSEQKEKFILIENNLASFNGNRSLIRKFSSENKKAIKKYFRTHKIRLKKADDDEMKQLIEFINTLDV